MNRLPGIALVAVATMAQAPGPAIGQVRVATPDLIPRVVTQVLPKVTPETAVSGELDIEVVVGTAGTVTHARVGNPKPGRAALEQAALEAARNWTFRPALDRRKNPVTTLAIVKMLVAAPESGASAWTVNATLLPPPRLAGFQREGAPIPTVMYTMATPGLRPPRVVREVRPEYTADTVRAEVTGTVKLTVMVLADGTPAWRHWSSCSG